MDGTREIIETLKAFSRLLEKEVVAGGMIVVD